MKTKSEVGGRWANGSKAERVRYGPWPMLDIQSILMTQVSFFCGWNVSPKIHVLKTYPSAQECWELGHGHDGSSPVKGLVHIVKGLVISSSISCCEFSSVWLP